MENPERIWVWSCQHTYFIAPKSGNSDALCPVCGLRTVEYIRADLAAPLPRPSDEPLRDAIDHGSL